MTDILDASALSAYLDRIGVTRRTRDLETLRAIAWGQATRIPFENLDIVLGRTIRLELDAVHHKLVGDRRGGYCFEHGALAAAALRALGFTVTTLAARVRSAAAPDAITARSHMLLAVELDGERHLFDAGFGGQTPTGPVPLHDGAELALHHDRYRLIGERGGLTLQVAEAGGWDALYWFTDEPFHPIDYVVANHYTSTHPSSFFTLAPIAARTGERGRIALRGGVLTRRVGGEVERTPITSGDHLLEVLASDFELRFPAGTRFKGGPA